MLEYIINNFNIKWTECENDNLIARKVYEKYAFKPTQYTGPHGLQILAKGDFDINCLNRLMKNINRLGIDWNDPYSFI